MANPTIQGRWNQRNPKVMNRNSKEFTNFSYFLAGVDVTNQNLDQFTPYLKGISRLFVHKLPLFMIILDSYNGNNDNMCGRFKQYLETGYKSISGINDIDIDFTSFEAGFAGQKYEVPNLARDQTETLTVSVYELTGSPIREFIDTWATGVRDPRSGIAHYHGIISNYYEKAKNKFSNASGLADICDYGEENHTMEFIYTTYDPTGLYLEYACMFAKCFPRKVPKDHLNYESGNRGEAQLDLEFSATKYESSMINDIGIWYTQNSKILWNYLDFNPEQNGASSTNSKNGTIGDTNIDVYTYNYGNYEPNNNGTGATASSYFSTQATIKAGTSGRTVEFSKIKHTET